MAPNIALVHACKDGMEKSLEIKHIKGAHTAATQHIHSRTIWDVLQKAEFLTRKVPGRRWHEFKLAVYAKGKPPPPLERDKYSLEKANMKTDDYISSFLADNRPVDYSPPQTE